MLSRSRLAELSDSLKSGFFSDNVVLTLARIRKRGKVQEEDKKVLLEVIGFFENILEGFSWSKNPKLTMNSAASAHAFRKAVSVLPKAASSESFEKLIRHMISDTNNLRDSLEVNQDSAEQLINFFTDYGYAELERTDNLNNTQSEHGSGSWIIRKALFA